MIFICGPIKMIDWLIDWLIDWQLARADTIHSQRDIKDIFDPEKLTFSINSGNKSI